MKIDKIFIGVLKGRNTLKLSGVTLLIGLNLDNSLLEPGQSAERPEFFATIKKNGGFLQP